MLAWVAPKDRTPVKWCFGAGDMADAIRVCLPRLYVGLLVDVPSPEGVVAPFFPLFIRLVLLAIITLITILPF